MIPVLRYHSLSELSEAPSRAFRSWAVSPAAFDRHCRLIARSGRTPMTVSSYAEALRAGRLPAAPVVITFDGGCADTLHAVRRLVDAGITATVYVTTSWIGRAGMLTEADLHRLGGLGVEIGGHGHTHRRLDELPRSDIAAEVTVCRRRLSAITGIGPRSFAYPHGSYGTTVRQLVVAAGYTSACAVRNALSHPGDDPFALSRLAVDGNTPDARVEAWLDGIGRRAPHAAALRMRAHPRLRGTRPGAVPSGTGVPHSAAQRSAPTQPHPDHQPPG
jgi:peptidoglycan/xylan/chitin deacetylase (PgdA/CDA1 family)